jgi:TRAP-type C4-dicarboxylate transport system substrate-binding protein
VNCPVVVNIDAYDALSDEHRAALDAAVEGAIDHYLANYGELLERWDAVLEERGVEPRRDRRHANLGFWPNRPRRSTPPGSKR